MQSSFKKIVFCLLMLLVSGAWATHNRSGEILYRRIPPFVSEKGAPVYTYLFTLIKYTDHGSNIADRCADTLHFGDGWSAVAQRVNGGKGNLSCQCGGPCGEILSNDQDFIIKKNVYTFFHTYSQPGTYTVYNQDPNRTAGVHNIPGSDTQAFYIESTVVADPEIIFNASPELGNPPTDKAVTGKCFYHNACAYDADGDSLSYGVIPCKNAPGSVVPGYTFPETSNVGSYGIDAATGLLYWCNPQLIATYNIALLLKEWRKFSCNGPYRLIGSVSRDLQVIVGPPSSAISFSVAASLPDLCVVAGAIFNQTVTVTAAQNNAVLVSVLGEMQTKYTPFFNLSTTQGNGELVANFNGPATCAHIRARPYSVDMKFTPNSAGPVAYRHFGLRVVPPAPLIYNIVKETSRVTLYWKKASCQSGLHGYYIYRKIGPNSWAHGACETGVPASSGFELLDYRNAADTSYSDINLWEIADGSTGNYIVTTVMNDCAESFASINTLPLSVGIKPGSAALQTARVYPNPFTTEVKIALDDHYTGKAESVVSAADGKIVYQQSGTALMGEVKLQLNDLAPGVYFLRLKTEKGLLYRKLAKE